MRALERRLREVELEQLDSDAKRLFEQDTEHAAWLHWETLDESMRAEYRRLALAEREPS